MDTGDAIRISSARLSSARSSSSDIWRNNGKEIFSRSSRNEDDEEALKWAAIEKLPTYLRIRRSILAEEEGQIREVDVENLGLIERRNLLERLLKTAEEDNEKFLSKLKQRIDRVGLDFPTIEVRFEHLNVEAEAYVGSRALPTIFNFYVNILEGFLNYFYILPSRKKPLPILNDVSGIIKPRRMTLLLGPPGSGKTTLLLALAGKLSKDLKFSGRVTYNGQGMEEFVPQRTSSYVSQHDLHIGEMTVRETLAFSARCQGVGPRYDMLAELSRREKEANIKPDPDIDIFMKAAALEGQESNVVVDYIIKVTSRKDQEQYWANKETPYRFVTVKEFSEAFQSFHIGRKLGDQLAIPFDKSKGHPAALTTKKYGVSQKELLRACVSRELLLMRRNSFVYFFKMFQLILMAFITMTVFLRIDMHRDTVTDGGIYFGALFFTVIVMMFNGFSEVDMTIMKLPVFYKQRDLLFFPAWAYSLPTWILKIPITLVEVAIWVIMTYYVIGYDPYAGRFFKQYFLLLCLHQMASGLFRFIAAIGRNVIVANTFGSFGLLTIMVLGGFIISRDDVKPWWIWGYWISPLMYAQNAIAVNEFLGKQWRHIPPNFTEPLGVLVLKSRSIFPEVRWYWIGVGAMIGYIFLFNFLFTMAMKYLDRESLFTRLLFSEDSVYVLLNDFHFAAAIGKPQAVMSKETLAEQIGSKNGEVIELSLRRSRSSSDKESGHQRSAADRKLSTRAGSKNYLDTNRKRGMVLPFEPLSIAFDDIRYAIDMPQEMNAQGIPEDRLELLKGVSGAFRPGTTLMDVLAGRKTGGYIDGTITISGYPKKQETFARISGYCEQTDIHSPHVTIYESLVYSAWLRLPPEVDSETRKMFIEEVMELIELTALREALVGLPGVNGLSTEQRKRLTIAVELVANPSIIFMDEPTSGLDARAAAIVMRTVRNTVDTGRTVVCTIHQPSIDIFDAFDELFLLKRGGEEIYVGPLGQHSSHLINYFEGISGVPKIKNRYNPATWMLEVTTTTQEEILGVNFTEVYRSSELYRRNKALINELSTPPPGWKDLHFPTQYSQSFFTQCMACLWKQHWSYGRNQAYTAVRLLFTTFIALMFGTIFWNLGSKRRNQQDLFNAMGSMYAAVLFIGFQNTKSVQPVVAIERTVFYRERGAGMYSALPYAFAHVIIEIPYIFVQTVIYGVIVYTMIRFEWTAGKFFWYIFCMFFTLLFFTLYGMTSVAVTPNHHIATITSSAFFLIWNLFSGFIVPRTRIPIWWRWYSWACPMFWTLYGLVASQFGDVKDALDSGETVEEFVRSYFGFRHDFLGGGRDRAGWNISPLWIRLCLLNQSIQLPKEMTATGD
ncbi:hypothetical protein NL676_034009 [Syzygium grande]|nr:hypothetical protein NL676_034009 [Syzygium grande]